jgi:hypothetical protein
LPGRKKENTMAKSKKSKKSKSSVKVRDLAPRKNAKGGRKAGKEQQEYMKVTMEDLLVSS